MTWDCRSLNVIQQQSILESLNSQNVVFQQNSHFVMEHRLPVGPQQPTQRNHARLTGT